MHQSLKLYLLLSSVFILGGCAISKYNKLKCGKIVTSQQDFEPVLKPGATLKYKASIDVLKNHLTGFLLVKQTDSLTKRLVFVTELGMKMFDFEAKGQDMQAIYVFDPLNKPLFIDALKRNFNNMLLLNAYGSNASKCDKKENTVYAIQRGKDKRFYSTSGAEQNGLVLQETFHKHKLESRISYQHEPKTHTYTQIKCKQYGLVKFYFELNAIPPTND